MKPNSLFAKMFLGYIALIVLTVSSISMLIHHTVTRDSLVDIEEALERKAYLLAEIALPTLDGHVAGSRSIDFSSLGGQTKTRLTVVSLDGVVLADSAESPDAMDNHSARPEIVDALETGTGISTRFSRTLGQDMMYFAMRVETGGEPIGVVRTALPLAAVNQRLAVLRKNVLAGMLVALLLSLPLGYLFARHITKPLGEMTVAAQAIAAGEQPAILPAGSTDEIGKLARALDEMAKRLGARLETIARGRSQLEAMLGSMTEGVVAVDRESKIVHLNAAATELCAVSPDAALGMHTWEALRIPELDKCLQYALARNEPIEQEISIATKGKVFSLTATPWRDSTGTVVGAVVVLHDISKLHNVERMRQEFIANASHEFKSPLTSIRGFAETMLEDPGLETGTRQRFTRCILEDCQRLTRMVQDMLALSRAESGGQSEAFAELDVGSAIEEAVALQRQRAESGGLKLTCQQCGQPLVVKGSREALVTAIGNLLDNAISHTPAGGEINVTAKAEAGMVEVSIKDNGVGIAQAQQAKIFERFYRVDNARSRELGGTGLGLAIVKHTALSHGGSVAVDSTPGQGSTFTLTIPLLGG